MPEIVGRDTEEVSFVFAVIVKDDISVQTKIWNVRYRRHESQRRSEVFLRF